MKGGPCDCLRRIKGGGGGGGSTWALPLAVLFLQTGMPLLIRHTRKSSAEDLYHPASLTLLAEVTKCIVAFAFMYAEARREQQLLLHQRGGFASVRKAVWETGRRFLAAVWRLRCARIHCSGVGHMDQLIDSM